MKDKSISIWLMGGLGNQLFQLNKAIELSDRGFDVRLIDNLILKNSFFASKVLKWKIHDNFLPQVYDVRNIVSEKNILPILISKAPVFNSFSIYGGLEYDVFPAKNMFGYFQNKININLNSDRFFNCKDVSDTVMHIRLGDNNNLEFSKIYYLNVIRESKIKYVKVVTDDNDGAKKFLDDNTNLHYEIISSNTLEDFAVLRGSKTVIAAPSTFSFWAVISSKNAEKVYVPNTFLEYVRRPAMNWIVC